MWVHVVEIWHQSSKGPQRTHAHGLAINNWTSSVSWASSAHLATTCSHDTLYLLPWEQPSQVRASCSPEEDRKLFFICVINNLQGQHSQTCDEMADGFAFLLRLKKNTLIATNWHHLLSSFKSDFSCMKTKIIRTWLWLGHNNCFQSCEFPWAMLKAFHFSRETLLWNAQSQRCE